jgi:hypothetical protein
VERGKGGGIGRESEAYVGVGGRGGDGAWRDGPAAEGGERGGASLGHGAAEGGGRRGSPADPESAPFHRRCRCSGEPAHRTNLNVASMNLNRCHSVSNSYTNWRRRKNLGSREEFSRGGGRTGQRRRILYSRNVCYKNG